MPPARLDTELVARGIVGSRTRAKRHIEAGEVLVNGRPVTRPSQTVASTDEIEVTAPQRFVSRAGDKLANALEDFSLTGQVAGCSAIDIGSSTGGFTDCLLAAGARSVIAVDVGTDQLHASLRTDPRVTVMEQLNARDLTPSKLPRVPDLLVCDCSFIPSATVLAAPVACMEKKWWGIVLIKPQFEAGSDRVPIDGIIRDDALRATILDETIARLDAVGVAVHDTVTARPRGEHGNIEFCARVGPTGP